MNMIPLNGGSQKVVTNSNLDQGFYLSPQYTNSHKLSPSVTEWNPSGRPIYNRLPSASQTYKLIYDLDENAAYCFIPTGGGLTGEKSLSVQPSGEGKYLTIQSGIVSWKYGSIEVDPVLIDLEQVGIGSARYVIGYQLTYDDSKSTHEYYVEDFSLSGQEMNVTASTDSVSGWRYSPQFAFCGDSSAFWSNADSIFPNHTDSAFLTWETSSTSSLNKIVLRCPSNSINQGKAHLYYMTCQDSQVSEYCSNASWNFALSTEVEEDDVGQFFEFSTSNPISSKGWRVVWDRPDISINNVYVSGVIVQVTKPETSTTNYALVAYPVNSVPKHVTNADGLEVPVVMCSLAQVDIDSSYTVYSITDLRNIVGTKKEPIADWLTLPWDQNMISLYKQFSQFPELWLNPPTCMKQEYEYLSKEGVSIVG